jgi:dihydroxy-acid dehydratase
VDPAELEARRPTCAHADARFRRGYRSLYSLHVEQADRGCDFDFLRGASRETLPDGLFDGWVGGW